MDAASVHSDLAAEQMKEETGWLVII